MEELLARLQRRHPHVTTWMIGLTSDGLGVGLQFAVVDRWRREYAGDVDVLYRKLVETIEEYNIRKGREWPVPTKEDFARIVALHLPMICGVSWRRLLDLPSDRQPAVGPGRVRRSR